MATANSTANHDREKHEDHESNNIHKTRSDERLIEPPNFVASDDADDGRDTFVHLITEYTLLVGKSGIQVSKASKAR